MVPLDMMGYTLGSKRGSMGLLGDEDLKRRIHICFINLTVSNLKSYLEKITSEFHNYAIFKCSHIRENNLTLIRPHGSVLEVKLSWYHKDVLKRQYHMSIEWSRFSCVPRMFSMEYWHFDPPMSLYLVRIHDNKIVMEKKTNKKIKIVVRKQFQRFRSE